MISFDPYAPLSTIGTQATDGKAIANDFDTFLTLLTTQLQNQNPLDPLDTNQFTEQLVQFSSVEQQIKTNQNLEDLAKLSAAQAITGAVSYIGKQISASGETSQLINGAADWGYELNGTASRATYTVFDESGSQVYTETIDNPDKVGTFTWNGTKSDGTNAPDGSYRLNISATDGNGGLITASTSFNGIVSEVDMSGSEIILKVGDKSLKLSEIQAIKLPQDNSDNES